MRRLPIIASLLLLLAAFAVQAQTVPIDLEFGYRWTDIEGDENLYRSQINERDGLFIRSLTMLTTDFDGKASTALDHFRLDITDLGTSPSGALRLEAGKSEIYRVRFAYRTIDAFSSVPTFANPFLGEGVLVGQHTFDRTRTIIDADLELLRWGKITPFIGYTSNQYSGPGTTTYHVGQDEFLLSSDLDDSDREIRGGFSFITSRFTGQFTQGWRQLESDELLALVPGKGAGNNARPILDRNVTADSLTRRSATDVDTPFTNFYVVGQLARNVRVIGNYSRFSADSDQSESEEVVGSLASFRLGRFYDGLTENVRGDAKNKTWKGGVRAEIDILSRFDFVGGYRTEHRELEGTALITSLYVDSITFGGVDRRDLETIVQSTSSLDRDIDVLSGTLSTRTLGPFTLRAGVSRATHDLTLAPDLEEIVVPGNQQGTFERNIDAFDLGGTYAKAGLSVGASWKKEEADTAVLRTDFIDRDRVRLRAAYHTPGKMVRVGVTAEQIDQSNRREGIGYDGELEQFSGDVEVAPIAALRLRGSYSMLDADSVVTIRRPETFALDVSEYAEEGEAIEGGVSVLFAPVWIDADVSRFENDGSFPFTMDRIRLRAAVDIKTRWGVAGEWANDEYDEALSDFQASRFSLSLRWRQ